MDELGKSYVLRLALLLKIRWRIHIKKDGDILSLKPVTAIFYQIFMVHQMIALQEL